MFVYVILVREGLRECHLRELRLSFARRLENFKLRMKKKLEILWLALKLQPHLIYSPGQQIFLSYSYVPDTALDTRMPQEFWQTWSSPTWSSQSSQRDRYWPNNYELFL